MRGKHSAARRKRLLPSPCSTTAHTSPPKPVWNSVRPSGRRRRPARMCALWMTGRACTAARIQYGACGRKEIQTHLKLRGKSCRQPGRIRKITRIRMPAEFSLGHVRVSAGNRSHSDMAGWRRIRRFMKQPLRLTGRTGFRCTRFMTGSTACG